MNYSEFKKEFGINCEDERGEDFFTHGTPKLCPLVPPPPFPRPCGLFEFLSPSGTPFGVLMDPRAPHAVFYDEDQLRDFDPTE